MSRLSRLLDDPNGLKKVQRILYGATILLLVLDVAFWAAGLNHAHLWLENLPLFATAVISVMIGFYPDFFLSITRLMGGG